MNLRDGRKVAYTAHEVTGIKFVESDEDYDGVGSSEYPDLEEYFLAVYSTKDKAAEVVYELIRDGFDLYDMSPIEIYE